MWEIEYTDEFFRWWDTLSAEEQDCVGQGVDAIRRKGPQLGRPKVDTLKGCRYPNLKELRTQAFGRPLRTFFAFDPRRTAILLIGGDKTGDSRFYQTMIPKAEQLYEEYLDALKKEGII